MKKSLLLSLFIGSLAALFTGCATHITTTVTDNPAPKEAFSSFSHFEITPIKLLPPYAGQDSNEAALKKIQEQLNLRSTGLITLWNEDGAKLPNKRTLLIEPYIPEIKFIGGGARFMVGAMAGSSAVILRAKFTIKETGEVIAHAEFYARADGRAGAWTVGGTDNMMLTRIADRLGNYLQANYPKAVGGPSGLGL